MSEEQKFLSKREQQISKQGENQKFRDVTNDWMHESIQSNYSYNFDWLGRPVIQYPQDLIGTQQLLWSIKPDLIIETGIARGGSLIFYASMLELIAQCGGPKHSKVIGIDIDIRSHNKEAITAHPMSKRIEMIQGSSIDEKIFNTVKNEAKAAKNVLVCLDSNHTHDHVLKELRLYGQLVSLNSYIIVFDTVVEDLDPNLIIERPWTKGNNPKTAVFSYLEELQHSNTLALTVNL